VKPKVEAPAEKSGGPPEHIKRLLAGIGKFREFKDEIDELEDFKKKKNNDFTSFID